MFGKIFESLYNKVFVNIVVGSARTTVYIEQYSKNGVVDSAEDVFDTISLNRDIKEFIALYVSESPFHYISILDASIAQGALPTCTKNKISYYEDLSSSISRCYDKKWTFYTSQEELYAIERKYEGIGIDFVFSPFTLLANFFKDKIETHIALFLLIQENHISLSIFDNSNLLYAQHLDLENDTEIEEMLLYEDESEDVDIDDGIDLDDISAIDEIDSFDDFGDIEDLDSIEDTDDFLETADVEEEFHQEVEENAELPLNESDGFNEDYQRFLLIQSAINNFYKNEKFESEFIQNVYMADAVGVSADLKRYLEDEMFMDVYTRRLDLASSMCELAKMELNL